MSTNTNAGRCTGNVIAAILAFALVTLCAISLLSKQGDILRAQHGLSARMDAIRVAEHTWTVSNTSSETGIVYVYASGVTVPINGTHAFKRNGKTYNKGTLLEFRVRNLRDGLNQSPDRAPVANDFLEPYPVNLSTP